MIRFLDSLAGTIAGLLIGVLLMSVLVDTHPYVWSAAARSAPDATPAESLRQQYDGGPVPLPSSECLARTGQPDNHPGAPTASPPGRITPSSSPTRTRPEATTKPRTATSLRGIATWFRSPAGVSAAGPDLRAALGPGWRGTRVRVCSGSACIVTVLGDWMRADRLIDLHRPLFARLAPLSRGVLTVTVEEP